MTDKQYLSIFEHNDYQCSAKDAGIYCTARAYQLAHGIANTKANRKKYGNEIIDSPFNLFPVCGLYHNSKMNIGNNPEKVDRMIALIRIGKRLSAREIREELVK